MSLPGRGFLFGGETKDFAVFTSLQAFVLFAQ